MTNVRNYPAGTQTAVDQPTADNIDYEEIPDQTKLSSVTEECFENDQTENYACIENETNDNYETLPIQEVTYYNMSILI